MHSRQFDHISAVHRGSLVFLLAASKWTLIRARYNQEGIYLFLRDTMIDIDEDTDNDAFL